MQNQLTIALLIALAYIAPIVGAPSQSVAAAQHDVDPAATANALLDDLDAGCFDAVHPRFAPAMAQAVSADKLKAVWASLPQQSRKFERRGASRVETASGMTIVDIALAYEQAAFGNDRRVTIRHYQALNHPLVAGEGPGTMAEYATPEHVDAQVATDIAGWIRAQP